MPRVCASPVVAEGTPRPLFLGCVRVGHLEKWNVATFRLLAGILMTPFHVSMFLGDWGPYETQKHKNRGV